MTITKKQEMIEEIEKKIKKWDKYSEFTYGYKKEDAIAFITRFRIGIYDSILKEKFWFGKKFNIDDLVCWDADRRNNNRYLNNITEENFRVYTALLEIKEHAIRVNNYPKSLKSFYKTHRQSYEQTPMTKEEEKEFNNLYKILLSKNYNWREARSVIKALNELDIYENPDFPHNIDEIKECLSTKPVSYFQNYFAKGKCCFEIQEIRRISTSLIEVLTTKNCTTIFEKISKTREEEYLRRMILSDLDIPTLIYNYDKNNLKKNIEIVKKDLEKSTAMSKETIKILFSKANMKEILMLIKTTLRSLINPIRKLQIQDVCMDFQQDLGCKGEKQLNTDHYSQLTLANGTIIYSGHSDNIKVSFTELQKHYEFLYANANELEYTEGCIEILGEILTAKLFKEGNKKTAVCLFNSMLMSRGILPPVVDLNQNEQDLLKDFIYNKNDYYSKAIEEILDNTINLTKNFNKNTYNYPLLIGANASLRPMFTEEQ